MSKIFEELKEIGLNKYESRAYCALLRKNNLSASEISKVSEVPQGRIYNVLDNLAQEGFCSIIPGPVKRFSAISPKIAIQNLINEKEKKLLQMHETAKKLEEEFNSQADQKTPLNYIKIYTSKSSLIDKINEMSNNSSKSYIGFNKPPYSNSNYEKPHKSISNDLVLNMKSKNVEMRELWEIDYEKLDKFLKWVKYMQKIGVNVRITERLPIKFMISDDIRLLFLLKNNEISKNIFTSMFIEHSDLVEVFRGMFELFWEKALTIDEYEEKEKD
ncbi:MAG: TrmB family transcriptional regulator [Armatimonadetes bacterium]|nr:TrmB family transcriptional regulator [Armatimonadota bacterium]